MTEKLVLVSHSNVNQPMWNELYKVYDVLCCFPGDTEFNVTVRVNGQVRMTEVWTVAPAAQ